MIEVLKQAFDALVVEQYEVRIFNLVPKPHITKAIASLNQAIAELESQEPWCMKMNGCTAKCEDCPDYVPPAAQPAQEPVATVQCIHGITIGYLEIMQPVGTKLYTTPPQRTWIEPTGNEWFEWWRVSQVADETEAEIDFADFLIIAHAVSAKLKELNNG